MQFRQHTSSFCSTAIVSASFIFGVNTHPSGSFAILFYRLSVSAEPITAVWQEVFIASRVSVVPFAIPASNDLRSVGLKFFVFRNKPCHTFNKSKDFVLLLFQQDEGIPCDPFIAIIIRLETAISAEPPVRKAFQCRHDHLPVRHPTSPTFLLWRMFVSHFVFPVFFAPRATSMISARSINGFTPCVRLAVFFAMFYSFIKTHPTSPPLPMDSEQ